MQTFFRFIVLLVSFNICSVYGAEEKLISRDSINSFLATSAQIAELTREHIKESNFSGEQDLSNSASLVTYLEASSVYPQLKEVLKQSNFSNLTELTEFSERLMGMRLYAQMKSSKEASVFQTVAILKANLNTMRANSASESVIKQTETVLQEQIKKANVFQALLDKITEQDKQFIEQNLQWFLGVFFNN